MSAILKQVTSDWLSEIGLPLESDPVAELMVVACGQREIAQLPESGWWTIACVDCESIETLKGTLSEFAEMLQEKEWCADSLERSTAVCKTCANAPDSSNYSIQYREGSGGLL